MDVRDLRITRGEGADQSLDDHGLDLQIVETAAIERGKREGQRAHLREEGMPQDLLRRPALPRGCLQNRVDQVQRFRGDLTKIAALRGAAEVA